MGRVIKAAMRLVYGDLVDDADWNKMNDEKSYTLGLGTFTRARYLLDIAHMVLRRQQWTQRRQSGHRYAIQLCALFVVHAYPRKNNLSTLYPVPR